LHKLKPTHERKIGRKSREGEELGWRRLLNRSARRRKSGKRRRGFGRARERTALARLDSTEAGPAAARTLVQKIDTRRHASGENRNADPSATSEKWNRAGPQRTSGRPAAELARMEILQEIQAGDQQHGPDQSYEHEKKNLRFATNTKQDTN
jgi:hypothetical protein